MEGGGVYPGLPTTNSAHAPAEKSATSSCCHATLPWARLTRSCVCGLNGVRRVWACGCVCVCVCRGGGGGGLLTPVY